MQTRDDDVEQKVSANKLEKDKLGPDHSEYESLKPSGIITGLCTDMCPGMSLNYPFASLLTNGCHLHSCDHVFGT